MMIMIMFHHRLPSSVELCTLKAGDSVQISTLDVGRDVRRGVGLDMGLGARRDMGREELAGGG
ncbi:hypothetical protein FHU41_001197 [Psychromicrobium silvestre]|uniref:Uncharacterized protein n=1 Tax=Psychromicrobium silvestre TaxID=1645614 RepID=A0A7Y9LSV5_9MICC|nr:hypothetical protein [Psychromicrobium silvestre]